MAICRNETSRATDFVRAAAKVFTPALLFSGSVMADMMIFSESDITPLLELAIASARRAEVTRSLKAFVKVSSLFLYCCGDPNISKNFC